ncbi:hypothetical protein HPB48_011710 [Haemaphysalis longicornis]|uniref:Uncharacterized protein n=1 Tax=Haemaphysalis longicornis TaxID=44386 RepID=A0A9J6H3J5_HAELO|nr:hypothetical protein HPB48_011710 [Haemaphysalis longicornis]
MKVRAYISPGQGASVGVVYDVEVSIPDADLPILIKPATEGATIKQVTRVGKSRCVKLVFQGDCTPAHVKVGPFRHAVRPFGPKPLQCHKCLKIGHVISVCGRAAVCSKCCGPDDAKTCTMGVLKCANCRSAHDASSKTCPRLKEEQQTVKDHSSHKDASAKVRRHRRSRRRRSSSAVLTKDRHDLSRQNPPASQALPPPPPHSLPRHASPPPAESTSCLATASTGKANKTGKSSPRVEDWPRLPSLSPAEPRREDAEGLILSPSSTSFSPSTRLMGGFHNAYAWGNRFQRSPLEVRLEEGLRIPGFLFLRLQSTTSANTLTFHWKGPFQNESDNSHELKARTQNGAASPYPRRHQARARRFRPVEPQPRPGCAPSVVGGSREAQLVGPVSTSSRQHHGPRRGQPRGEEAERPPRHIRSARFRPKMAPSPATARPNHGSRADRRPVCSGPSSSTEQPPPAHDDRRLGPVSSRRSEPDVPTAALVASSPRGLLGGAVGTPQRHHQHARSVSASANAVYRSVRSVHTTMCVRRGARARRRSIGGRLSCGAKFETLSVAGCFYLSFSWRF